MNRSITIKPFYSQLSSAPTERSGPEIDIEFSISQTNLSRMLIRKTKHTKRKRVEKEQRLTLRL